MRGRRGGDTNHDGSASAATFAIASAASVVTLTCPAAPLTFTGTALTPCTASVAGDGGLSQTLTVGYSNNIGAGVATASATFAGDSNHNGNTASATFTIAKATPAISWATPSAITYGTALSAAQLNAASPVPGTFVYTPVAGTVLTAGSQTLSVAFTPTDTADYTPASALVTLTVNPATPSSLESIVSETVTDPAVAASLNKTVSLAAGAPNGASRAAHLNKFVRDVNAQVGNTLTQAQADLLIAVANTLY